MGGLGLAIGIGSSLLGGMYGNKAADEMAKGYGTSIRELSNYNQELRSEMGNITGQLQPYSAVGTRILPQLLSSLEGGFQFDPTQDPAYLANLRAQEQAVNRASAASGGFYSGQRGVDLARTMSDLASREYASQYDRYRGRLQDLSGMLQFGYGALTDLQSRRAGYLGSMGDVYRSIADLRSGKSAAKATGQLALGGMFQGIGKTMGTYYGGQGGSTPDYSGGMRDYNYMLP